MGLFEWLRPSGPRVTPAEASDSADEKEGLFIKTGRGGSLLFESDIESPFTAPFTPFTAGASSENGILSDEAWNIFRSGSGFQEILEKCPENMIPLIGKHGVTQLGTFQLADSAVIQAFGKQTMLTRGSESDEDPDYKQTWTEYLDQRLKDKTKLPGAFLSLLLQKYSSGTASKKVWEFPAVRAVINYNWDHWAHRFLLITSAFYVGWVISFALYLILYIEFHEIPAGIGEPNSPERAVSYTLNILTFIFMCPFAIEEYYTVVAQRYRWINLRNLLDMATITLQILIFVFNLSALPMNGEWYGSMLAVQCILLSAKLQNFGRVLGAGASSFSEIFISVTYDARYLLAYTSLTVVSMALCLGTLYKQDKGYLAERGDFNGTRNSLVTTSEILFGSFNTLFIFNAEYPWLKFFLFVGFQVLMTITMLNLFIAVMTESYSKFKTEQTIRFNRGRAGVIEELEVLRVPNLFPDPKPYIHFLTVEKKASSTSHRQSLVANGASTAELNRKIDETNAKLDTLLQNCTPATPRPFSLSIKETSTR